MLYLCNSYTVIMSGDTKQKKRSNLPEKSGRLSYSISQTRKSVLKADGHEYKWNDKTGRLAIIRNGIPYDAIEVISKRIKMPVKALLQIVNIPQTTYNKKKSEHALLESRESELMLLIYELLDYGKEVFNQEEEKFLRWLQKPNISLGGVSPVYMFDTITGVHEVTSSLHRLEYGNLA